ncbi:hypothetical protein VPH35_123194 [Triticum aestivum]
MPWPRIRAAVVVERRPPPVLGPQLLDQVAPSPIYLVIGHAQRRLWPSDSRAPPAKVAARGRLMHERRRPRTRLRPEPLHASCFLWFCFPRLHLFHDKQHNFLCL